MKLIRDFFRAIDERWPHASGRKIPLRLIGSAALMLQAEFKRVTTDSDLLETQHLDASDKADLLRVAGPGSELHRVHGLYLQILAEAIPLLPQVPRWHPVVDLELQHFELTMLDIVDVCVSKLKRFAGKDMQDIEAMANLDLLPHDRFVERFKLAVDMFAHDARADDLPRCCENFNFVEKRFLRVPPTTIELPSWV